MGARASIDAERGVVFFWLLLLLFVATTVVGVLLAPHPHGPQPSALGDFSVPTAEEGRAIPVIFGTCKIAGGNTVWWGDLKSSAVRAGGGILSFGSSVITGYKYFLGCQFMLCHGPIDELVAIQADKKNVPYTSTVVENGDTSENYRELQTTGTNLFGGTTAGGGGGISGKINFYRGLQTQQPDAYLSAKQGRIDLDQSGIGYEFAGGGNGTISGESGGSASLDETITITAYGIDGNHLHGTYGSMEFHVVGSRSGAQINAAPNSDGSRACWADQAFSCPIVNFTILRGSVQFVNGDRFTIVTEHSKVAAAYRGKCYAVFCQLYVGTSNYLKPLAFIVRRCPDPLGQGSGVANISGDANAALAVYELLTNPDYGLGLPSATIDATSFAAAAVTLAGEGLGISMQIDTQGSADQLIGEILRHVDGLLYTDPATGLWTIVLARGGYDASTLPELTVDSVASVDFSRGSWTETMNRIAIKYSTRVGDFADAIINAYDPANIVVTGAVRPQTIDFKGISNATAAALVAIRVLKTLTYPLAKVKLVANRSAWAFRPGGLFRLTWIPLGISDEVFRITRIAYGDLLDGKITIDAVEDIFGINSVAFVAPPSSGWVSPLGAPLANAFEQLFELPLHIGDAEGLTPGIFVAAMAARNAATSANDFEIWIDDGGTYVDAELSSPFCPVGFLAGAYPAGTPASDSGGFVLTAAGIDLQLLESGSSADMAGGAKLLLVDQEIMAWQGVTENSDGTYTIAPVMRGVMDTTPQDHAPGAKVWFFSEGLQVTQTEPLGSDGTVTAKLLPENSAGSLPIGSATAESVTTRSRFARPYPPGKLCMQAQAYGTRYSVIAGALALTWKSRNRLTEVALPTLVAQDAADITPEASTTYDVKVLDANGVQIHSETGISAETWSYTAAQRLADGAANPDPITVKIWANVGGSLESFLPNALAVSMSGFGMQFGKYFGGVNR